MENGILKGNFSMLKKTFLENNMPKSDLDDLKSFIETDDYDVVSRKFGKKVSNWIGKMYKKALDGSWNTDKTAAPGLLAQSIANYYGF